MVTDERKRGDGVVMANLIALNIPTLLFLGGGYLASTDASLGKPT